ncbi:hypothetical protein Mapa_014214 [Marchantia paleacea]|nr:hypothetical protein Mapa_014214 [Marchantia paleacea]
MKNLCSLCGKSQSEDGRTLVSGFFTRTGNRFCAHCGIQMSETWLQFSRKAQALTLEKIDFLYNNQSSKSPNNLFPDVYLRAKDGMLVPAHKHMLARKSSYFENLFETLKPPDKDEMIVNILDMTQGALQSFVTFFYTATVDHQQMEEHIVVLLTAAINYAVYYLRHQCEKYVADRLTHRKLHWAYAIANEADSPYLKSLCETFVLDRINGKTVLWALDTASKFGSVLIRRAALAAVLPSRSGVREDNTSLEPEPQLSSKLLDPAAEDVAFVGETLAPPVSCSHKRNRSIPECAGAEDAHGRAEHAHEELQGQKKTKMNREPQCESSPEEEDEDEEYDSDYYEYSECSSDSDWERHVKPGYEWEFDQPLDSSSEDGSLSETFRTTSGQENSSGSASVSRSVSADDFQKSTL